MHGFIPPKYYSFPDHTDVVSASMHTTVTGSNEVPVSVVDMDVPVTAIDEVLEDFDCKIVKNEAKLLTGTKSTGKKGMRISIYTY